MNIFKNKVDTYLRRADYTYIKIVGLSISQLFPFPLVIWVFALDDNLDQFCYRLNSTNYTHICLILGHKSCVDMKLVKLIMSVDDSGTTVDTHRHFGNDDVRLNQLLAEYSDLFDGIGELITLFGMHGAALLCYRFYMYVYFCDYFPDGTPVPT